MMNLALPTLNILPLFVLLLYMFISVYIRWASQCMCRDGNSGSWREWDKTGRRMHFWVLCRGELETTDLGLGIGVHSSVYPYCDGFRSLGVGILLALGGYELASVWNQVDQLVDRTSVHTTPSSVGLETSWARQVRSHTYQEDSGVLMGERWRWDHPLRATPVWPHGGISQFRRRPFWRGTVLRAECGMGP
jgi:hypothetical protein